jgi:hypothetical protein
VKLQQVSDHFCAVLNEANRVCDANSGLINLGGGVVVDTQSDLSHARQMIDLFSHVWSAMPRDKAAIFDSIFEVANARGMAVEY